MKNSDIRKTMNDSSVEKVVFNESIICKADNPPTKNSEENNENKKEKTT